MVRIFDYTDYRIFMKEEMDHRKLCDSKFSYRYFNGKIGFKSTSALKAILDRKRNLTSKNALQFASLIKLGDKETRYFIHMIEMNNATTFDQKNHYLHEMLSLCPKKQSKVIKESHYSIFLEWYYIPILEMVRLKNFKEDPERIASLLRPNITPYQVKKALAELVSKGFLARDEKGRLIRQDAMFETPSDLSNTLVHNFQSQMSERAKHALHKLPLSERYFSTLTIAVSEEQYRRLARLLYDFKKKAHDELESEVVEREHVAHVNLQLFKVTRREVL